MKTRKKLSDINPASQQVSPRIALINFIDEVCDHQDNELEGLGLIAELSKNGAKMGRHFSENLLVTDIVCLARFSTGTLLSYLEREFKQDLVAIFQKSANFTLYSQQMQQDAQRKRGGFTLYPIHIDHALTLIPNNDSKAIIQRLAETAFPQYKAGQYNPADQQSQPSAAGLMGRRNSAAQAAVPASPRKDGAAQENNSAQRAR